MTSMDPYGSLYFPGQCHFMVDAGFAVYQTGRQCSGIQSICLSAALSIFLKLPKTLFTKFILLL